MRQLVDRLDHRMLLPQFNPLITLDERAGHITAAYGERRYTFPQSDVVVLPIPNTTAEMLAEYLAKQLLEQLAQTASGSIHAIEIEVEESFGQSAIYREVIG
jgi:6-pyruvoyltetrahydropterin/6-carboxytetrahydropterin synthase